MRDAAARALGRIGEPPRQADRLRLRLLVGGLKGLAMGALIAVGSVELAGADRGWLLGTAVVVSAVLGCLALVVRHTRRTVVDLFRRRALREPRLRAWRSPLRTAAVLLAWRPLATLLWVVVPLGIEWVLGGPGVVAAVVIGLCVFAALDRILVARWMAHVERERGEVLLVEGGRDPDGPWLRRTFLADRASPGGFVKKFTV